MVFGLFFLPLSRIWSQKSDLINKSFTRFLLQSLPEKGKRIFTTIGTRYKSLTCSKTQFYNRLTQQKNEFINTINGRD